jgi:hypothetical protein
LSNEEFNWDRNSPSPVNVVSGPAEEITCQEVNFATGKMKSDKAAGPSGVVVEMLWLAGDVGVQWMTDLCNAVVREGKIPEDWNKSWLVSIYTKEREMPWINCGSNRGIKLLDQAMKVMERVMERRIIE